MEYDSRLDLSIPQRELLRDVENHGLVPAYNYHVSTVKALVRRKMLTVLKRPPRGSNIGVCVRLFRSGDCGYVPTFF